MCLDLSKIHIIELSLKYKCIIEFKIVNVNYVI